MIGTDPNRNTSRSKKLFADAMSLIVGGVASRLHKSELDPYPIYLDHGVGSRVFDVDGNEYIDYVGGFGPMILGFCPPKLGDAVIAQIGKGSQFACPTESLNTAAKMVINAIPCADRVTFQGTGTEAVMVAFRFARAYTGKSKIVKFEGCYHGWADEQFVSVVTDSLKKMGPRSRPCKVLSSMGQRQAASEDIVILPFNDLTLLEKMIRRHHHEIAAIIMEPIMCNCEVVFPASGYLEGARKLTEDYDILLIFDEIITGFRVALGGAQERFGVFPDLCTFGKAVAGGYPLAGVAGRRAIMETAVQPVGTFNANPIVIAACIATLEELNNPEVYKRMERMTQHLVDGVNKVAEQKGLTLLCRGMGSIWQIAFGAREPLKDYRDTFKIDKLTYQRFRKKCLDLGINFHPSRGRFYTSAAHTEEDIDLTLSVVENVL